MVDGDPGLSRKSHAWLWWFALIVGAATLFATLVILRMPRPPLVEPPQEGVVNQPPADQPVEPNTTADTTAKQTEPPINPAPATAPEPVPDFDARRFTAEFTLSNGAESWPELFAAGVAPQPFTTAAFRDDFPPLTADKWHRWLDSVDNEVADVSFEVRSAAAIAHLKGMLQLRCPWPRDGVLHFIPLDSRILMFWFWNGAQGVALVYHPQANCAWAAYRIERAGDSRRPKSIALAALDKDALIRAPDHGFDIHPQAEELIVSQRGVRLLAVPFAAVPQAVYIYGDSWFRAFGMDRRLALPELSQAGESSKMTSEQTLDAEWIALPDAADRGELTSRLVNLAWQSADRGDSLAFAQWDETLFTLPAWSNGSLDARPLSLALAELVPLVDADRRDDVAKVCRKLRFSNQPSDPAETWPSDRLGFKRLIEWGEEMKHSSSPSQIAPTVTPQSEPNGRQHPWIVDLGRDALSPAMGLATAVADSALDDACKFITETPQPGDAGLVPDPRDSHLSVGWPQSIRNTLHDEPRLVTAMQSGYGRLGELRLSRAVAEGDADAVRTASVQFLGTQIAAVAHLELGDRALALGKFAQALAEFQAGRRAALPDQVESLDQRVRLAASFIGMDVGRPAGANVILNAKNLSAEQFDALVAAQRRRATVGGLLPSDQCSSSSAMGPPPGQYALQPVVSWAAASPLKEGEPASSQNRALLAAQPGGGIYITGALGTTAVGLQERRIRWSHPQAPNRALGQTPERMVSAGDRLFWSRPADEGVELTCLDANSGTIKWRKTHAELPIISDPVWSQRQLFVVTDYPSAQGERRIAVCELNPDTGETLVRANIGRLTADETGPPICILAAIEDRLVLATSGGVICCDRAGNVHWLQRSTWLPADIRGLAPDARVEPAMFVQPSAPLIVLQPAVPGLQAFDLETGRRVWQRAIPDLHRVAGSGGGLLVAMTPRGLLVFHAADGAFAWHHEFSESPFASAICEDGHVVTASIQKDENGKQQLFLKWFDRGEDRRDAVTSTAIPAPPMASIAGLGSTAGRFFVVGSSHDGATAWLSELVPVQPPGD